jgi:GntR family transcriptional repressor for pyruvate dehydrogenase complex
LQASEKDDSRRLQDFIEHAHQKGLTRLPPEPKLSEQLGISRGRLRTLLKKVEADGLIWRHVGRGTFIGARRLEPEGAFRQGEVSVGDVIDARLILEPPLAAQAAIHATPADIAAMDECVAAMKEASTFASWKRLDAKLHRVVAEASHNLLLLLLYDTLRAKVTAGLDARMEQVFGAENRPKTEVDLQHQGFIDAIRTHNPERADFLMREHLQAVRQMLFGGR